VNKMPDILKIPTIGDFVRNGGKLIRIETAEPTPPPKDYIFEEITARCEMRFNDKVLKELGEISDYYGLGTSITTAIKEMKEYANSQNITDKSDIEIVVIKVVSQTRKRPIYCESYIQGDHWEFESLSCGSKWQMPDDVETVVWSSKRSTTPVETQNKR
jgi:hypothetical protein